jgi:hypothetical protein
MPKASQGPRGDLERHRAATASDRDENELLAGFPGCPGGEVSCMGIS